MSILHTDGVDRALRTVTAPEDDVLVEMEARADRDGFPTVGAEVGAFLQWIVHESGVSRVFECGSGFGYSAYWMAGALPEAGEIVLTEIDRDELDDAAAYLESGGRADVARFEHGDALEILAAEPEPFDLILLDHENERYREGFETAVPKLAPGGIVVADNVLHSYEYDPADVAEGLADDSVEGANDSLAGILAYYRFVSDHPAFDTTLVPLGEGLFVTVHTGDVA